MQKITKQIPYQRFHNSEIRNLVKEVLAAAGSYASLTVLIKIMLDRLSAVFNQIEALNVKAGKHPETTKLQANRSHCVVLVKSIVSQVKNVKKAKLESQLADITVVDVLVSEYLKPIVNADWSDRTQNLEKMFAALNENPDLQTALTNLHLKVIFDELEGLVINQDVIKRARSSSQMRRRITNTLEVRALAIISLKELFAAIELAQIEHPEADFTEMITGINKSVDYFSAKAKGRITRSKKKPGESFPAVRFRSNLVIFRSKEQVQQIAIIFALRVSFNNINNVLAFHTTVDELDFIDPNRSVV